MGLLSFVCVFGACGDGTARLETRPAGTPYEMPIDVSYDPLDFDHIVEDNAGGYYCVLRRPDDLAALRATFNSRSG